MFNVIIIGGEDTENYDFFKKKTAECLINKARSGEGITILTTGDAFIDEFTKQFRIDKQFFPTDWRTFGKEALKYRNEEILKRANAIIFFQNGRKDSQILFDMAVKRKLPNRLIEPPKDEE